MQNYDTKSKIRAQKLESFNKRKKEIMSEIHSFNEECKSIKCQLTDVNKNEIDSAKVLRKFYYVRKCIFLK